MQTSKPSSLTIKVCMAMIQCLICGELLAQAEDEKKQTHPTSVSNAPILPIEKKSLSTTERLIRDLGDEDFEVREDASKALSNMGSAILPALVTARQSSNLEIQAQALRLYAKLSAVPLLKQALLDIAMDDKEVAQCGFLAAIRITRAMTKDGRKEQATALASDTPDRCYSLFQLLDQVASSNTLSRTIETQSTRTTIMSLFTQRWETLKKKNMLFQKPKSAPPAEKKEDKEEPKKDPEPKKNVELKK